MEDLKRIFDSVLRKYKKAAGGNLGMAFFWKIIVVVFLSLFVLLMLFGWLLYNWVITNNSTAATKKIDRPEITLEDINKAKDLIDGRKEKLEMIIKNDVEAIDLK